jgi:hypothetical protein
MPKRKPQPESAWRLLRITYRDVLAVRERLTDPAERAELQLIAERMLRTLVLTNHEPKRVGRSWRQAGRATTAEALGDRRPPTTAG